MDKGLDQKGPCQKTDNTRGCQSVPNVNIPETETIKLARTYQEKRRKIMDMVVPGRRRKGGLDGDESTTTEKI